MEHEHGAFKVNRDLMRAAVKIGPKTRRFTARLGSGAARGKRKPGPTILALHQNVENNPMQRQRRLLVACCNARNVVLEI
jgi:hypothetical protein